MPTTGYDRDAERIGMGNRRPLLFRLTLWGIFVCALAAGMWLASIAKADELVGTVQRVQDGDTFDLCEGKTCRRIRVCGINAPERGSPGHREAAAALQAIVARQVIVCRPVGEGTVCDDRSKRTTRGRLVAQCFIQNGPDIAAEMVRRGLACDWVKFSGGYYGKFASGRTCSARN